MNVVHQVLAIFVLISVSACLDSNDNNADQLAIIDNKQILFIDSYFDHLDYDPDTCRGARDNHLWWLRVHGSDVWVRDITPEEYVGRLGNPAASPDGTWVALSVATPVGQGSCRMRIYVGKLGDQGVFGLSDLLSAHGEKLAGEDPRFAHMHQELVFKGWEEGANDGRGDIYLYDFETGALDRLTSGPCEDWGPVFSPDDNWVIFTRRCPKDSVAFDEIYAVGVRGEHTQQVVQLTSNNVADHYAGVLLDGTIVFARGNEQERLWLLRCHLPDAWDCVEEPLIVSDEPGIWSAYGDPAPIPGVVDAFVFIRKDLLSLGYKLYVGRLAAENELAITRIPLDPAPSALGPVVFSTPSKPPSCYESLCATGTRHRETEPDLDSICASEVGPGYVLADWTSVRAVADIQRFAEAVHLYGTDDARFSTYGQLLVAAWGERFWADSNRHYFIERHDGVVPANWLVHDEVGGHFIDLGSWYDLNFRVLCQRRESVQHPDLTGTWRGVLTQPGGPAATSFDYEMRLWQAEAEVTGYSRIATGESYGVMELYGEVVDGVFEFHEYRILEERRVGSWFWCLKSGRLRVRSGPPRSLSGPWSAPNCMPGEVQLHAVP